MFALIASLFQSLAYPAGPENFAAYAKVSEGLVSKNVKLCKASKWSRSICPP